MSRVKSSGNGKSKQSRWFVRPAAPSQLSRSSSSSISSAECLAWQPHKHAPVSSPSTTVEGGAGGRGIEGDVPWGIDENRWDELYCEGRRRRTRAKGEQLTSVLATWPGAHTSCIEASIVTQPASQTQTLLHQSRERSVYLVWWRGKMGWNYQHHVNQHSPTYHHHHQCNWMAINGIRNETDKF